MSIPPQALFIIQAIILIGVPFLLWRIRLVHTIAPLVVIQIILGIILGPTVLGNYLPEVSSKLFSESSLSAIGGVATLGLCLLGFMTGLHFDITGIVRRGGAFIVTSMSTLLVPLIFGVGLALLFFRPPYIDDTTSIAAFTIGLATAIAVTALPVLSAILIELKLIDTPLGKRVLGYAAVNDISLWIIIACLTAFTTTNAFGTGGTAIIFTITASALFLLFMHYIVRRICRKLYDDNALTATPSSTQLALVLTSVLVAALITELIGLHFIFGAFVFGAIMPKELRNGLYRAIEQFTLVALMPFYFMLTGLKIDFSFSNNDAWLLFAAATLVAIMTKIAGTTISEYYVMKTSFKEALNSGVLMQTKGLMEVIVLDILLTAHVINQTVFSALVVMAVVTTFLTKPLLLVIAKLTRTTLMQPAYEKV